MLTGLEAGAALPEAAGAVVGCGAAGAEAPGAAGMACPSLRAVRTALKCSYLASGSPVEQAAATSTTAAALGGA